MTHPVIWTWLCSSDQRQLAQPLPVLPALDGCGVFEVTSVRKGELHRQGATAFTLDNGRSEFTSGAQTG